MFKSIPKTKKILMLYVPTICMGYMLYILTAKQVNAEKIEITNEDIKITSEINISANTGNNKGSVKNEGQSQVNININQSINGEKKNPIVISETSQGGSIEVKVNTETKNGETESSTTITKKVEQNNQEQKTTETKNKQALINDQNTQEQKLKKDQEQKVWLEAAIKTSISNVTNFLKEIQKYVRGIFA